MENNQEWEVIHAGLDYIRDLALEIKRERDELFLAAMEACSALEAAAAEDGFEAQCVAAEKARRALRGVLARATEIEVPE